MIEALQPLFETFAHLRPAEQTTLLLVGGLLLGLFIVWNLSPWRALVAWLVTFSIQFSAGSFHLSISDLFLLPLAVGSFLLWIHRKDRTKFPSAILLFALLFLTVANIVTALTFGRLPQWTWLNKDLGLIALLLPFWSLLVICRDQATTEKLIRTFVLAFSLVNAVGVALYICSFFVGFGDFVNYGGMRFKGFMLDPNSYAGLAGATAILQFAILNLRTRGGLKVAWGLVNCCVLVAGCLLTLSRGGFLSLVAGGITLFFFTKARSTYVVAFTLIAISLAVVWLASATDLTNSIQRRADDRDNIDSRIDYIEQGMRMYMSSPLTLATGIGIGTFIEESPKYFGDNHQIHNTYVWLLVEGGPLLLGAYMFMLYRALKQNWVVYRRAPHLRYAAAGCFCALVTTIVWSMTVEGMYHHHFWILLAFSQLLWTYSRDKSGARNRRPTFTSTPNERCAPALAGFTF